jgi:pantoate--beta-alanine ligase
MACVSRLEDLRATLAGWRARGERTALVPTMGALHEGHLSLARIARQNADRVVVSIFVNPTQFGPGEDFSRYPRTLEADRDKLGPLADLIFTPDVDTMYPPGSATTIQLSGPAVAGLEDRIRPRHFDGVATVVTKLLIQVLPDFALFGEKDYQQLKVVERLAGDLFLPIRIVPGPTIRDPDGLALSSRNRYLTARERSQAPELYRTLQTCAEAIRSGCPVAEAVGAAHASLSRAGFELDYLEARDADTLAPVPDSRGAALRLLVAARLGSTRLIDNIGV